MKRIHLWLVGLTLLLSSVGFKAEAQSASDYSRGHDFSGNTAVIYFKANVGVQWVDAHFSLNNAPLQNLRMGFNSGKGRYEQSVPNASKGQSLRYFFTYNRPPAADTPQFTDTVGSASGGGGGGGLTSGKVCFYDDINYGGASFCANADSSAISTVAGGFNDRVSSVKVQGGNQVELFRDGNYGGGSITVTGDEPNLPGRGFNDVTSSFRIQATGGGNGPTTGKICFYDDINYGGAFYCADSDSNAVSAALNDRISSVRVQSGNQVQLFVDANYSGNSITVTGDEPNLPGRGFNDVTSSFRVQAAGGGGGGTWNERTTFVVQNATRGRWGNQDVYYAIIGKSWTTGKFVWIDAQGNQRPMALSDNGALKKNGKDYTNYFHKLSDLPQVTISPINSARILMSVGSPMFVEVNSDINGNIGYAGANIDNTADPNLDVTFDFGEMAILPKSTGNPGIYINTTRVDQFGFPLRLRVQGLNGFDRTVGDKVDSLTRDQVFSNFIARVPAQFKHLAQGPFSPYRIVAPTHGNFRAGGSSGGYLQGYIDQVWSRYRSEDLVFTLQNLGTFRGRVNGDSFRFTGGNQNGTYFINGKPDSQMVLLGSGLLADARNAAANDIGTQLQIQAQVAAALNRHVMETPAQWYTQSAHYPAGQAANWYAKFWHDGDIGYDGLAYGFSYDDVGGFSPSVFSNAPTTVTYTIGW